MGSKKSKREAVKCSLQTSKESANEVLYQSLTPSSTGGRVIASSKVQAEIEKNLNSIIRAIQSISTFTTNALAETFESPEIIEKDLAEKNYEDLILNFSKVILNTIEAEYSEFKSYQRKSKEISNFAIPEDPILEISSELVRELGRKEQMSTEESSETRTGQELNLNSENFCKLSNSDTRPIFNNYTHKAIKFFDPFLQFGGESM